MASSQTLPPTEPQGNEVLIYSDGACTGNPGPAALGVVMLWDQEQKEYAEYLGRATNNIAELTAIARALGNLTQIARIEERAVHVYTDSQYSIGVLSRGWKAKANQELIATIRSQLRAYPQLQFHHVRGHQGIPLNERADELARDAIRIRRG